MSDDNTARKFEENIPDDLAPLPTMPYSERPLELPLDIEECRTAIWMASGNISEAASILKITSIRLRNFVRKSAYLSAEMQEAADRLVDIAESNVKDALTDANDVTRRDTMSRFVLTNIGRQRGWGSGNTGGISVKNTAGGTIIVQWEDGSKFGEQEAKTIEGEAIDVTDK